MLEVQKPFVDCGRISINFDSIKVNKKIEAQKFFSRLREIQAWATQAEADKLMLILNINRYGHIKVTEFLVAI